MKAAVLLFLFFSVPHWLSPLKQDFYQQRKEMVEKQIFERGITNQRILTAFNRVKRHLFVDTKFHNKAYGDFSLPIDEDQTISHPYIVAIMTYVLAPAYNKKVLEIGTGSGYQAAILAELVKQVYTIEIKEVLAKRARKKLLSLGYKNIKFKLGDGYNGWREYAPYDGIVVTCSPDHIPAALIDQLAAGGRMVIPISYSTFVQELILIEKDQRGNIRRTNLIPVEFGPLIRGKSGR
jgi:protein-L-isoaspartate(D-aspartate) O-methyltransferase